MIQAFALDTVRVRPTNRQKSIIIYFKFLGLMLNKKTAYVQDLLTSKKSSS